MTTLTTLASFNGVNGSLPGYGSLVADTHGNLFGTTLSGGDTDAGTVFELVNTGSGYTFQTLASLNAASGSAVYAGLTIDQAGNLFGAAQSGGAAGFGAVFELANTGSGYSLQTVASFSGSEGANPTGGLVADANGNLFGTTQSGGAGGQGTVFELVNTGSGYTQQTLASFNFGNGAVPNSSLITDSNGNLFGATLQGGPGNVGTVFELENTGSGYTFHTLAAFDGSNGSYLYAGLTADAQGDLFGTTYLGGANGYGTVFELVNTGSGYTFKTLASLDLDTSGGLPLAGVSIDAHGDLFGAATAGGAGGAGTLFELVNTGSGYTLQTVYAFSGPDGAQPKSAPIVDASGNLYGTTAAGGPDGEGTVYEINSGTGGGGGGTTLGLNVNGGSGTPVGEAGATHVGFTVAGMAASDTGTVTFTDKDGNTVAVDVVGGQTHYSADFSGLDDGAVTASLVTTSADGHTFTQAAGNAVTLDTVAPGQPAAPADASVAGGHVNAAHNTAAQTITGTAEAGAAITIYDNGTQVAQVTADNSGAWSWHAGVLGDGAHSVTVTASDLAGNTSAASDPLSFTVDTSLAQPPVPADASVINGYVNAAHDTANQSISGTTVAGASIAVYDNGTQVGTATADGSGAWSYQVGALGDGAHSFTVTATVGGATSAASNPLSFTVDASAPAKSAAPADAAVSNGYVNAAHDTAGQTISGTAEAGATVAIYDNGTQVGTASADDSGAWAYQVGALGAGAHSFTVTATDAAGNTSAASDPLSFTVDTSGPAKPGAPADASVSNGYVNAAHDTAAQTITGTAEAGASVSVYDNGTQVGTATADGSGAWSYQVGALGDGPHSVTVTATDAAGNTSAASNPLSFTVDTHAPAQPAAPADASVSGGYVNAAHDTAAQTIIGTAEAGASVAIYDNGTQVGTATADNSGAWSYQVGALGDGAHSVTVTATDAAGNISAVSNPLSFTVDTSAPAQPGAPADASVSGGYVNAAHDTAAQTISGTAEAGASVAIYDNGTQVGTATADNSGAWSYQVGALGDGAHSVTVTATDAAGNVSAASAPLSFTVDTSAPAQPGAPADASVSGGYVNAAHDAASQTIIGTAEAGASVAIYDNGTQVGTATADGSGAWTYQAGALGDGAHSVTVTATDAAGNVSAASNPLSFTVDTSAPAQPGAPADAAVSNGHVDAAHNTAAQTINGVAEAGATVAIYDNGTAVATVTADNAGAWSYQVGALGDGTSHSYTVTAADAAGNVSAASDALGFTIDTPTGPAKPGAPADASVANGYVNAAHDSAGQTIVGVAEAGASIAVYDNGTQVGTATADGSGAWSFQVGALGDGTTHSFTVTATDASNNTSAASDPLTFTVDTSAPGQPGAPADASVAGGYVNAAHDTAGQTITGTTEAGVSVAVFDNGTQVGSATADGMGAWSYQVGALGDGAHSFTVTATDDAGNTSAASAPLSFTVDASSPAKPGAPADGAVSNGYVNAAHDTAGQTIGGTAEAGAAIAVYDNGTQVGTATADGSGAWSYQVDALGDGAHAFTVTATDAAGNTSAASDPLSFMVDTGAPAKPGAPADASVAGGYVNAAHDTAGQTINGVAEAGASIAVYDNGTQVGTATADGSGAWTYQVGALGDGSAHSYTVTATDAAGNTSAASDALSFTVDTSAPAKPGALSNASVSNGYVNAAHDTAGQTIIGTAEAGATVAVYDNGTQVASVTADGSGAWNYPVGALGDGAHSFTAKAVDAAGNLSAASDALAFTVDTSSPAKPGAPADVAVVNGFVGAAHDTAEQTIGGAAEAGASVAIYDNGTQVGTATADGSGAWTYQVGALGDGTSHSYTVTATDAAGNISAASEALNFTVDTTAPTKAVAPTDAAVIGGYVDSTVNTADQTISGVVEAGASVAIYDNGAQVATATADGTGAWSYKVGALPDGSSHSYAVTATDAAGNTGAMSDALTFTVGASDPPPPPPVSPATPDAPTDAAVINGYVNRAHDTFRQKIGGVTEAGASVTIYDHGTQVATVTANANGAWSYRVGELRNGSIHSYTVTATANGATSGMSDPLSFTVDTTAPRAPSGLKDASIAHGFVNKAHDTAAQALTGTAEAGSVVTVYDNGHKVGTANADANTGAWSFQVGILAEGWHELNATATDAAGNTGRSGSGLIFMVDTHAPIPVVNAVTDGPRGMSTVSGSADAGSTITLFDGGQKVGMATAGWDGKWSVTLKLNGSSTHQFTETAVDLAGNVGASTGVASWASAGNRHLVGGAGDDVLIGQRGDTLTGGGGHDHFVIGSELGKTTITDFVSGQDQIRISHHLASSFYSVMAHARASHGDTVITFGSQSLTLQGVQPSALHAGDFFFT